MIETGIYSKCSLAAVWACDTKARQILYLGPQLGISVNINMVENLVVMLGLTVRTGDDLDCILPPR